MAMLELLLDVTEYKQLMTGLTPFRSVTITIPSKAVGVIMVRAAPRAVDTNQHHINRARAAKPSSRCKTPWACPCPCRPTKTAHTGSCR